MADPAAAHLRRNAYIYVRQSTLAQTVRNTESLLRQYDLAGRARELGWAEHQIVVVDDDLGRSGASAQGRTGFSDLVADVGLGKAGIVLSLESSRLARNNSDWYQLLDLCALTDTLIADADGVYHPGSYNDRLVLGLKGTLSEAELHLLRSRMTEGLRAKAARGELRLTLPAGLDYDDGDHVIITPDEAAREAITCVFRRFDQLGSARQVVVSLRADGLRLPRRDIRTGKIAWAQAGYPAVHDILIHPGYAGVFAYGRSKPEKHLAAGGTVITRQRRLPRDQWAVMIPGHHPGYISLETYDANIARLAANSPAPAGGAGGAAREGAAWLQGLLRCGRCGRLMQVNYHSSGSPAYRCGRANQMYGAATCQRVGGRRLHETVLAELLAALAPACLAATVQAMADTEAQFRQNLAVFERALERARFEAGRALRQYDNVEPENRLVARTLEAVLEDKLTAVRTAENQLAAQQARRPVTLTEQETAWITTAGADLRAIFGAPATTNAQRKELIRAVITEVTVTVQDNTGEGDTARTCQVQIIWQGGASTAAADADARQRPPQPRHQRRHPRPDPPPGIPLRRHHHRPDPRPAEPPHRDRPGLQENPRQGATHLPRHPPDTRRPPEMSHPAARMRSWSASPKPDASSASPPPPSTGGYATASSPASSSPPEHPGRSASTSSSATGSSPRHPTAGCPSARPPPASASPARPC